MSGRAFWNFMKTPQEFLFILAVMASAATSLPFANEYDLQRAMNRQIMILLHRARNPRALADVPIMGVLCKAMRTPDPVIALERVVLTVFAGDDESAIVLRKAILEADFERTATNAELARRLGMSRRHFQRRRAEAIGAIAQYARNILDASQRWPASDGPEARSPRATPFERERVAFCEARDRANALEMHAIAGNLLRLAETPCEYGVAMECRRDAGIRLGRHAESIVWLPGDPPARLLLAAKIALIAGNVAQARERAQAAVEAMGEHDTQRYRALTLVSQACLLRSMPWHPPPETAALPPQSWERISMEVEQARHLALQGDWQGAETLAGFAQRQAEIRGYQDLAARSSAVLHEASEMQGELARSRWWRALAIRRLLRTQDRVLATGLFPAHAYRQPHIDVLLANAICERLCLIVPQMMEDDRHQRMAVRALLIALLEPLLASRERSARLESAVAAVRRSESAFAHYALKLQQPVRETLALALVALTGRYWDDIFDRLNDPLAQIAAKVRPAVSRAIAVANPSQSAGIDHLRVHDEPSGGRREPVEAFADLRVRRVSV